MITQRRLDCALSLCYNRHMTKEVTVQFTLEWTFNQRDWSDEQKHIEELKKEPKVILGDDLIHALFMLNDLDYPSLTECKVAAHE